MAKYAEGWRSRNSRARAFGVATEPPLATASPRAASPSAARPLPASPALVAGTPGSPSGAARGFPWQGVGWSISFIGLLVYIWSATTYRLPLGEPAMIVALIGLLFQREPLRVPGFLLLFAALTAWGGIGYLVSPYPGLVLDRLDILARVWLIALVLVNVLRTRAQQRLFIFVFLGAFALYPVRGTIFNYVGGYTVFGRALWNYIYANPNDLAALCLLQLSLVLALLQREPKGWIRLAALSGLFVLPVVILLTQSRGAIIALAVFALVLLAGQRRRLRTLATFVAVGGAILVFAPSSVWDRLSGLRNVTDTQQLSKVDEEGSAEQRFEIWKVATAIFMDHKITGVGAGSYIAAHREYTRSSRFKRTAAGSKDAHSTYLSLLAEMGLVGFALFAAMIGTVVLEARRVRKRARHVLPEAAQQIRYLELGLLAFFTAAVFASYAGLAFTYVHLALLWTLTRSTKEELDQLDAAAAPLRRRGPATAGPPMAGGAVVALTRPAH